MEAIGVSSFRRCSFYKLFLCLLLINYYFTLSIVEGKPASASFDKEIWQKLNEREEREPSERLLRIHRQNSDDNSAAEDNSGTERKNNNDYFLQDKSERKVLNPEVFKSWLKDLLRKLDTYYPIPKNKSETFSAASLNMISPPPAQYEGVVGQSGGHSKRHINSLKTHHYCSLHGLWLSTVAGAAIELKPERYQGHIELHTKIFELPNNPYPPFLTSQWTGKGIISQESPTTLTIVFQEHIYGEAENHAKEREYNGDAGDSSDRDSAPIVIQLPRTAVFVGQCVVCHGNPMLQGSWVVFPASQTCGAAQGFQFGGVNNGINGNGQQQEFYQPNLPAPDKIYLLHYF